MSQALISRIFTTEMNDPKIEKLRQALNGELKKERLRKNQEAWRYAKEHDPVLKQMMLDAGKMFYSAKLKFNGEDK